MRTYVAHPHALAPLMLALPLLALLCSKHFCNMMELPEMALHVGGYIGPVDVCLLAVPDLEDVRHTYHQSATEGQVPGEG